MWCPIMFHRSSIPGRIWAWQNWIGCSANTQGDGPDWLDCFSLLFPLANLMLFSTRGCSSSARALIVFWLCQDQRSLPADPSEYRVRIGFGILEKLWICVL